MAEFSAAWLALREPVDSRSRSARVARSIADRLPRERPIDILDLAAGTGSNARFLTEYFRSPQDWLLVDHDPRLLERAQATLTPAVATRIADLSRIGTQKDLFAGRDLVTASALLDLVSDEWLFAVASACREQQTAVLFALSYDGRIVCSPTEPEDDLIRDLVNRHQRRDKGFGPALGPDAGARAADWLERLGYHVVRDPSDWALGPNADELQRQLIDGWAVAASETAPKQAETIARWRIRRLAHVSQGRSHLVVGHEDLGAFMA
jgi:hypothetical protein